MEIIKIRAMDQETIKTLKMQDAYDYYKLEQDEDNKISTYEKVQKQLKALF